MRELQGLRHKRTAEFCMCSSLFRCTKNGQSAHCGLPKNMQINYFYHLVKYCCYSTAFSPVPIHIVTYKRPYTDLRRLIFHPYSQNSRT